MDKTNQNNENSVKDRRETLSKLIQEIDHLINLRFLFESNPKDAAISTFLSDYENIDLQTEQTIENSIEKLDQFNLLTIDQSFEKQINFLYEKRKDKYDEKKLLALLGKKKGIKINFTSIKNKTIRKNKDKNLSFEIKEELEGFVNKTGNYTWSDEKINDFIETIKDK